MRIVVISGSHPRHLYVVNRIMETGAVVGLILMEREKMIEKYPTVLSEHLKELYDKHFTLRLKLETLYFGEENITRASKEVPILKIYSNELNGNKVESFIEKINANCIFSYGPDIISDNILSKVDFFAMNLHGGLSPWYKGAATMFWPFYFLEPNYVGTTLHYITQKIDGGKIIHQSVPLLSKGDCMHEVSCKAVVIAADEVVKVLINMNNGLKYSGVEQKKNGKLFLERDWRPEHLQLIYDVYDDKIVDMYLNGELNVKNNPDIVSVL